MPDPCLLNLSVAASAEHKNVTLMINSAHSSLHQTQIIAAAAAGVAAEGLSPSTAKLQAENAAHLSVALAENAIVILMLVEDHLRLQGQLFVSSHATDSNASPALSTLSTLSRSNSVGIVINEPMDSISKRSSLSSDAGGLPLDVCIPTSSILYVLMCSIHVDL